MPFTSNALKAAGLGAAFTVLTAGAALAAVATSPVHVRTGPGTSYSIVDTLRAGEQVAITGRAGGWCEVNKAGPNGWVSCNYLAGGMGPRVNVYQRPYYNDYPRYNTGPSISFGFGFGNDYPRHHDYPHHDHNAWWW